ncbi:ubiquitin-protein ligase E3C [Cloeon dipterum]|uniref:ubiquitin-protein ligase E3C n=1 Tax=Cloeon dipterum TaxID=197152 RepID=UPI0032209C78
MFNGDFRRKPEQNLGGYGRSRQRDALLERVQAERAKREEQRKKLAAAIELQSFVRGCLVRERSRRAQRLEFDELVKKRPDDLDKLVRQLLFFYKHAEDSQRFTWLCKELLKHQPSILSLCESSNEWKWRLRRLLRVALVQMTEKECNITIPLRLLEVFINKLSGQHTFLYLTKRGYFKQLRHLFECRVPPMMEGSPIAPISLCLLDLLKAPIFLQERDRQYSDCILSHLAKEFLVAPLTDPMRLFILPKLAPGFPLYEFSRVLQSLPSSLTLLYSLLKLEDVHSQPSSSEDVLSHLVALGHLTDQLQPVSEDDDEEPKKSSWLANECLALLNEDWRVNRLLASMEVEDSSGELQKSICTLCHHLLLAHKQAVNNYRILYTLAFRPAFLRNVWLTLTNTYRASDYQSQALLLRVLARGLELSSAEICALVPPLAVFCSLFSLLLLTLHDSEFWGESQGGNSMPFTVPELIPLSTEMKGVCLGLIRLAFPESRMQVRAEYLNVVRPNHQSKSTNTSIWRHLFNVSVDLLRALHARDTRRSFCPDDHWIAAGVIVPGLGLSKLNMRHSYKPFKRLLTFDPLNLDQGPPLSTSEIRQMAILQEMPFVVAFQQRVLLFQTLVLQEKDEHQATAAFLSGPQIQIVVRRNYLYEDAFEKLSPENEPEIRSKMRVQLVNTAGLDEAGVDGGGVFREFLSELLKTAFDPNRGFFRMTADNQLYPNPSVHMLIDNFQQHYFFIGRMLGKALFENLLVELPMAEFFLSKLVGGTKSDVSVHQLASLDPVMYKNLIYLKGYDNEEDVTDLNLDFTVVNNELGESKVEELKPGGSTIGVTLANRIEYIHLIADYKLNKQIRAQCNAFKQGLADVIPLEWLQMFDYKEFQVLISGAQIPVNINDLRAHTQYTGGYSQDHPTIGSFWRAVETFNDLQRRQLLKFVTSCSRPPLLGFKELYPPFCIQMAGTEERLPSASTCMNLLKLPQFKDEDTLKAKLLYAIQAGAGFELS